MAPVRVAAVNDYEIVVAGLAHLLEKFPDRVEVVETLVIGEPIENPVDVALYDTYGRSGLSSSALRTLVAMDNVDSVAVFSLDLTPDFIAEGRLAGAQGFISKALDAEHIVDAIVRVASGEQVVAMPTPPEPEPTVDIAWPGQSDGLTERESEVIVLVAEGLSNREIGAALYLGYETVKSYLRDVYAKIGVRNRVEAANWVRSSPEFNRASRDAPEDA
jgi:two-component system, NarL family, response regulator LiaR